MLAQLKYGTPTTQIFWGCDESDTGGVLGVIVDGTLYSGETLNADNDYTGVVDVSGLGGSHTWQLALDGTPMGEQKTFQTAPAKGENFKMVVLCDMTGDCQGFSTIMNEPDLRYGLTNGDHYYIDAQPNFADRCGCGALPVGADAVVFATVLADYRCKHRCHLSKGTTRPKAFSAFPWNFNWHNHEFEVVPFQTTTVADNAGIKFQAAKQAADEYMFAGNAPKNGSWDTYPNPRVYHDFTVGDAHFVIVDHTSYGFQPDPAIGISNFEGSVPDGAGGTNTGNQQLDFIIDAIINSTSKFGFIVSPAEPTHPNKNVVAAAEWQLIFDALDASSQTWIILNGDTHAPMIQLLGGTKLPNNPVLNIDSAPLEHPFRTTSSQSWVDAGDSTRYFIDMTEPDANKQNPDTDYNYNDLIIEINPNGTPEEPASHTKVIIKNALTGAARQSLYVREGERLPVFPSENVSGVIR